MYGAPLDTYSASSVCLLMVEKEGTVGYRHISTCENVTKCYFMVGAFSFVIQQTGFISFFISHPGQSFSLSLCGPISISRTNAHMVHMG